MVQRKLGLQANPANPIKGLASQLKPSSSLKEGNKKIKKSRSMKLSNLETPKSSSSSPKKHDSELPNYMKATSSSVAKQPQVSPNIKKHGSGSCNKQTRTLTKSSSFKSVRTLTKSPSFKLARASSSAKKKRSGVALCADIDSQKATCSSTLKDSKFPDFLELSHGGTEAEGTSMVKVCPYLYCSLNGHHHKPSPPPLKMFLKAKRRVLKSQRSSKKIETESISRPVIIDEKLGYEDVDADMEYYVEIYAKNKVFVVDDDEDRQVAESLSDGSPKSEIDFEEGLEEIKVEDEDEQTQIGLVGEDCFESEYGGEFEASMDEEEDEETQMGRFCFESESEGEFEASMDVDEEDSEAIGVDKGATFSIEIDDLSYLKVGFSMEAEDLDVQGGLEAIEDEQSDDTAMEATTPASEEIVLAEDDDVEACNGDEESEGDMDHHQQQETELEAIDEVAQDDPKLEDDEAIDEVAQDDPQLEDEESEAALDHHHQQEIELEAIDEVIELISSDGALDHQKENELEAKDEGALDHHQEIELEAIDEVTEFISSSDGALDHQQETESEARDEQKRGFTRAQSSKSHPSTNSNTKWSIERKRSMEESEEEGEFNPREPTFLPLIPDPEAEKVDLRHQMIDERKNSDEWMLDYALQRTVTKLAPARKRKVALLVEAFESVLPVPRYHQNVAAFAHVRPIQACN